MRALKGISGRVLTAGDDGYDEARTIHNALIDRRPAVIVRCRSADDVSAAVRFARASGLEITIRGGGHNVAGRSIADGALMIDLAEMKNADIDPEARTVRAEGGLTWAELNAANAEHGLAVTGGAISTTGIAGLTLGGGLGWLMSKYGLAADNVIAVELVTADGEILDVTAESHPDLFWALRGGGGNFGVATTFTYRLHPLRHDHRWPDRPSDRGRRRHAPVLSRRVRGLLGRPDGVRRPRARAGRVRDATRGDGRLPHGHSRGGERDLAPFKQWGSPAMVEVGPMPYPVMNTLLDEGLQAGFLNYWLSSFTSGLSDGFIDTALERFASVPSELSAIFLEHFHGAVTRIGVTEAAVPHRQEGWNCLIPGVWSDPADNGQEHRVVEGHIRRPL